MRTEHEETRKSAIRTTNSPVSFVADVLYRLMTWVRCYHFHMIMTYHGTPFNQAHTHCVATLRSDIKSSRKALRRLRSLPRLMMRENTGTRCSSYKELTLSSLHPVRTPLAITYHSALHICPGLAISQYHIKCLTTMARRTWRLARCTAVYMKAEWTVSRLYSLQVRAPVLHISTITTLSLLVKPTPHRLPWTEG